MEAIHASSGLLDVMESAGSSGIIKQDKIRFAVFKNSFPNKVSKMKRQTN